MPEIEDLTDTVSTLIMDSPNDGDLSSEETTLMARIPLLAGNSKKFAYLAYRSTGFTIAQSLHLAECTNSNLRHWRRVDPSFVKFEANELARLQSSIGNDVIKFELMRNMRLLLKADMGIIFKAMINLAELSEREFELYKNLRKYYTPTDLLAIEKVINPEKHKDTQMPVTINLTWNGRTESTERQIGVEVIDNEDDL